MILAIVQNMPNKDIEARVFIRSCHFYLDVSRSTQCLFSEQEGTCMVIYASTKTVPEINCSKCTCSLFEGCRFSLSRAVFGQ